ncbi:MAG: Gfo/Idh/MocA family oxidoreductase [Spirochaetales bacterium]|nr:Gfo/Idh/MocA family oxidoreductase [Spirochaetales bacterium]
MMSIQQKTILYGAVYGAGFMGTTHLAGYHKLDHVAIVGVIDPVKQRAEAAAVPYGLETFSSIAEAAGSGRLDFIDICIPTPFHVQAVKEAFDHDCHVLVEKPITASAEDLKRMQDLVSQSSKRFMAAHVCRFIAPYVFAKKTIESGRLGKPTLFTGKRYSERPDWSLDDWINNRRISGGTLVDLSIHDVDIANWFLGTPVRMYASEAVWEKNGPAHVFETLEYENSRAAHVEASHLMPAGYGLDYEFQLVLERGLISCKIGPDTQSVREMSDGQWNDIDTSEFVTFSEPYTEEVFHFTESLRTGEPFRISFKDALTAVRSVLFLRDAVEKHTVIKW